MVTWPGFAYVFAGVAYVLMCFLFVSLYPLMFGQLLFSDVENWPKGGREWYETCFVSGFALLIMPFWFAFGHGFLHRAFSFRWPIADGSFSMVNLSVFAIAIVVSTSAAAYVRKKYENEGKECGLLAWPLFVSLVVWFVFGSSAFPENWQ